MTKKIITVFGATGVAGGSVAKYLLEDGEFAVRAVTRNANSDKAKALKSAGAEVVEADLAKPETLPATVEGAYGVSGLTDFWAVFRGDAKAAQVEETRQGRSLVDAAKAAGVKHFVWFNLWDSDVPHFVGKHHVFQYLESSGVPYTNFLNAFYYENLSNPAFGMFSRDESGALRVTIPQPPDTVVPSYSAEQSGGWVLAAFKNPDKYLNQKITALGDNITPRRYAEVLSKVFGEPVTPLDITYEQVVANTKSDNAFLQEFALNIRYFVDNCQPPNSVYGDVAASAAVYPGQYDFATFVEKNEGFKQFAATLKK